MSTYGIHGFISLLKRVRVNDRVNVYRLFFVAFMLKYAELISHTTYDKKYSLELLPHLLGNYIQKDELAGYLSGLFKNVRIESEALKKGFRIILNDTDTDIVREVFSAVHDMKISNLERLKGMTQSMLERTDIMYDAEQSFFDAHNLTDYVKSEILQCEEGMTVYDGFCKLGASINAVIHKNAFMYLQDTEQSSIPIAVIITTIFGNKIAGVGIGDTLSRPIATNCTFDRIILDPPLGMKIEKDRISAELVKELSINTSDIGAVAIQHAFCHLKDNGVAIVRVSAGMLSRGGHIRNVRMNFVDMNWIDAVIWLPAYERDRNSMNTALLVIRKKRDNDSIYMVDSSAYVRGIKVEDPREIIKAGFPEMYKNCTEKKGISRSVKISEICENEYNLSPLRYVSKQEPSQTAASTEEIQELQQKYNALVKELEGCDSKLNEIRNKLSGGKIWK